ncbi:MAG: hypothetical protein D6711_01315 [Chloroflexi bacterium]|nr:MAG: hypothetical protein D6711_01315 [Chloroflexota bacterium]
MVLLMILSAGCNLNADSQVIPTFDRPIVQFIAPENNTRVVEGFDLTLDLYAQDSIGVARIELRLNGQTFRDLDYPNYQSGQQFRAQTNWIAQGIGFHSFSAIAYRVDGTQSDEVFISIEVVAP